MHGNSRWQVEAVSRQETITMTLCDALHDEIAYSEGDCPLCTQIAREDDIRYAVGGLENSVMDLLDELEV